MRGFVAFVVLAGCHASGAPAVAEVPDSAPPVEVPASVNTTPEAPTPEAPPPPPDPCEGLDEVAVTAPAVELACKDEHRSCEGTATFGLRNCTASPIEFVEMRSLVKNPIATHLEWIRRSLSSNADNAWPPSRAVV